jgi:branched-chain amino acid transport system permease protein
VDLATLLQQVVNGLALGGVYALVAASFTLVFGTLQIINLAQGSLVAIGGFAAYVTLTYWGWGLPETLIAGALLGALANVTLNLVAFRPLRRSNRPDTQFSSLIASLAALLIIQGVLQKLSDSRSLPMPVGVVSLEIIELGPVGIPAFRVIMLAVVAVAAVGLTLFLTRTVAGRALRTVGWRVEVARVLGIPAERLINVGFGIAGALAAVAGVLIAVAFNFVTFTLGNPYLLKGLAAIILGGLGSVPGAILGGLFLGVAEALAIQVVSGQWRDAIAFGILMIVLVLRPSGFMGKADSSEVL